MHIATTREVGHYPLIDEFIAGQVRNLLQPHKQQKTDILQEYAFEVLEGGYQYFTANCMEGDVGENLELFRACRIVNPAFCKQILNTLGMETLKEEVRALQALKCCTPERINALLSELPAYIQACNQFAGDWLFNAPPAWNTLSDVKSFKKKTGEKVGMQILGFWDQHCKEGFEKWGKIAQEIFMLAPSSAAVERVFSSLRDKFVGGAHGALIDNIRTAIMLRANGRVIQP